MGMRTLKKVIIKKDGDVCVEAAEQVMLAIQNYRKEMHGREQYYLKHFSTFMNNWEDYLEDEFEPSVDPFEELAEVGLDGNDVQ